MGRVHGHDRWMLEGYDTRLKCVRWRRMTRARRVAEKFHEAKQLVFPGQLRTTHGVTFMVTHWGTHRRPMENVTDPLVDTYLRQGGWYGG